MTFDPHPYGPPETPAGKPGLTKRGKVAVGLGAAVLAGGGLMGYQSYAAQQQEATALAKEVELREKALRLEELKELNRANEKQNTAQQVSDKARQALVDSCVNTNKGAIGKGFGSPSYGDVVEDCQAQYPRASSAADMAPASAATTSSDRPASGGVNSGFVIGAAALAVGVLVVAKRGTRRVDA
ncbi:hypothetical protein [Streptomyces sp. NPDC047315]|uniref:hypothetical protein n=1 Tax=Streptomyces sp. NPDC047315 TaxID=3155142 RepID=UPI0033F3A9AD